MRTTEKERKSEGKISFEAKYALLFLENMLHSQLVQITEVLLSFKKIVIERNRIFPIPLIFNLRFLVDIPLQSDTII